MTAFLRPALLSLPLLLSCLGLVLIKLNTVKSLVPKKLGPFNLSQYIETIQHPTHPLKHPPAQSNGFLFK